ncbi:MAG TPA: HupE/UreJ family protein, partial [Leucothrix sp.]|nr:HupE/UreJ family protein [Leucothrix sp.]
MSVYTIKKLLVTLFLIFITASVFSDVVKPALIEINVNQEGQIDVEIRASIEALLTGINGKYKNTKDAPNAAEYDVLRKMPDNKLLVEFDKFKTKFLDSVRLMDGAGDKVALIISKVKIPEPGYTKVPRISVI